MANVRFDQLPAVTSLNDTDLYAVQQGTGTNGLKKATSSQIRNKFGTSTSIFKEGALLGDSITLRHTFPAGGLAIQGDEGFWNWGNYFAGAPFQFTQNMGVNGDLAGNIFSRIDAIRATTDCVFILAATNDILAVSPSATAGQITTAFNSLVAIFTDGLTKLRAAGKIIAIATVPPNNAYTPSTDARISLLDQLNAWIATTIGLGLADFVLDLFTICWNSALPTTRVFKTNYNSSAGGTDGQTHLSNLAGFVAGTSALPIIKSMYALSASPQSKRYEDFQDQLAWIGRMPTGLNPAFINTSYGTGFGSTGQASGYGIASIGAGSPTGVMTTLPFTLGTDFVGPNSKTIGTQENWQKVVISSAVSGSIIRASLANSMPPNVFPLGTAFGDLFWVSIDVLVESPVNLNRVEIQGYSHWNTDATNAAYSINNNTVSTHAGVSSVGITEYAIPSGYRAVLITEPIRIPENTSGNALLTDFFLDVYFNGAGSATIYYGRIKFWRKMY